MRFARKARFPVTVAVMEQKSAEAIVDKDSTTHGHYTLNPTGSVPMVRVIKD